MSGGLTEFEATLLLKITQDPQVFGPEGSSKINVQAFNERDVPAWESLQKHGLIKLTKKTDWQNAIGLVLDVIVSLTPLGRQKQAECAPGGRDERRRGEMAEGKAHMTDKNDVVIAIAASLYASRATDDALRAEPPIEALANEAWDLYHKLERAVRTSPRQHGDGGDLQIERT